jgi:hypothetical protein
MKLSPEQLEEIRRNFREPTPYDVVRLCEHIAIVEAERDAAQAALRKIAGMQVGEGYDWAQRVANKAIGEVKRSET